MVAKKKPAPSRPPVAPKNAPPALAGRGGESRVACVSDYGEALEDLSALAEELVAVNLRKAELDETAATLRDSIRELMEEVKSDESWTVRSEDTSWVATYIKPKETKKLIPELLIQAGVTTKQLEKGYKKIPAKNPYVQVRTKGEKTGSNEEHE